METNTRYGYKYEEGGRLDTAEIARLMRASIKEAKAEGLLPKHWKYSVTIDRFAGGSAINMAVKNCDDAWVSRDESKCSRSVYCDPGFYHSNRCPAVEHLTEEGEAAEMTLTRIHEAYNFDGSDIHSDYWNVNYYGGVKFASLKGD